MKWLSIAATARIVAEEFAAAGWQGNERPVVTSTRALADVLVQAMEGLSRRRTPDGLRQQCRDWIALLDPGAHVVTNVTGNSGANAFMQCAFYDCGRGDGARRSHTG